MKISTTWLAELTGLKLTDKQLTEVFTMAGLEVGGITPAGPNLEGIKVVVITGLSPLSKDSKLQLCHVKCNKRNYQVISGAPNLVIGQKYALATSGTKLADKTLIKEQTIQGELSQGMLCSKSELGLQDTPADELWQLPDTVDLGTQISNVLELNDSIIEFELTPNRSDCLSALGLARELCALQGQNFTAPKITPQAPTITKTQNVALQCPKACPIYATRVIKDINPSASSPLWLQEQLRRMGCKSIHPVVDITNYIMFALGQPMHAFDHTQITGPLTVRYASKGEELLTLDDTTVKLKTDTLVIVSQNEPLAIAGVIGGRKSGISSSTTEIVLESAYFTPKVIANKARTYHCLTDAAYRFERGVDYQQIIPALEWATELILKICSGSAGPIEVTKASSHLPKSPAIVLPLQEPERILGKAIQPEVIHDILTHLGCQVTSRTQCLEVTPPSYRHDLRLSADLIEEIARIHGYENFVKPKINHATHFINQQNPMLRARQLDCTLQGLGFQEVITYSFIDEKLATQINPKLNIKKLLNPISQDMNVMRNSLWPGLLQNLIYNKQRQAENIKTYETGLVFLENDNELQQEKMIAGLWHGQSRPKSFDTKPQEVDFYDLKAELEILLTQSGLSNVEYKTVEHHALHPGQSAALYHQEQQLGTIGQLHPRIAQELQLEGPTILFELRAQPLLQPTKKKFQAISKYPAINRDLALLVAQDIPAGDLINHVCKLQLESIQSVNIFDVYQGPNIPSGHKSIGLSLTLQHFKYTLSEKEIGQVITEVQMALLEKFSATVRN